MSSKYQDDPVKARSRHEIYKFANSSLPKDRSEATAVYLASDNNLETKLLDKLGVPRERRVILEYDKSNVKAVKKANPGIRVLPISTADFFEGEVQNYAPLWYCGLDYECMLNNHVTEDLHMLAHDRMLDGGVLYTNLVGQREQKNKQEDYILKLMASDHCHSTRSNPYLLQLIHLFGSNFDVNRRLEELEAEMNDGKPIHHHTLTEQESDITQEAKRRLLEHLPRDKLDVLRSYVLSIEISDYLIPHGGCFCFCDQNVPGADRILNEKREKFREIGIDIDTQVYEGDMWRSMNLYYLHSKIPEMWENAIKFHEKEEHRNLADILIEVERIALPYYKKVGLGIIPLIIRYSHDIGYVITKHRAYSYTSSNNTKMMLDVVKVGSINPRIHRTLEELDKRDVRIYYTSKRPFIGENRHLDILSRKDKQRFLRAEEKKYSEWLKKKVGIIGALDPDFSCIQKKRKNLGSGFRQPLTIALARKCILEGMGDHEISRKYSVGDKWGTLRAVRANVTKGFIKPKEKPKIKDPSKKPTETHGSKYLFGRNVYRRLPEEHRIRIDYFLEEVFEGLPKNRQKTLRRAFHKSGIRNMIYPPTDAIKFYAFFDDITLAVYGNRSITPQFIENAYRNVVRNKLVETREVNFDHIKEKTPIKVGPSEAIKEEVRSLAADGIPREDVWEEYGHYFKSRHQFGAVLAWNSPKLVKRRKRSE